MRQETETSLVIKYKCKTLIACRSAPNAQILFNTLSGLPVFFSTSLLGPAKQPRQNAAILFLWRQISDVLRVQDR